MINKYGGLAGIKDAGALEYVCEKPFLQLFNQEQYPDIFHKAAVLMFAIARGHYFYDGNKRTKRRVKVVINERKDKPVSA